MSAIMTVKELSEMLKSGIDLWGENEIGVVDSEGNSVGITGLLNSPTGSLLTIVEEVLEGEIVDTELDQKNLKVIENEALNERDYGDLSGLNKDEAREKWGSDQVHTWRRSFDTPPPQGESLKNTAERVLPYFSENILPLIRKNQEIIVAAHGNSLRALVMHLDNLSPDEVVRLEIPTGMPICYQINNQGQVQNKILLED